MIFFYFISSFFLVAFGQPALLAGVGILASAFGFALFWRAMLLLDKLKSQFWLSFLWFSLVQGVQLFWMSSTHYVGPMILVIFAFLICALGLQFAVLSLFFRKKFPFSVRYMLAIAGIWVIFEWARLFVLTGFTFNPVGIALSDSISVQWAAIGGVFWLSFWVVFVNLLALHAFLFPKEKKRWVSWGFAALLPYVFGWVHPLIVKKGLKASTEMHIALIQTALMPEQIHYTKVDPEKYIDPLEQWKRIWALLPLDGAFDLIVLPEAALPLGAKRPLISLERAQKAWISVYGEKSLSDLPPLEAPYAFPYWEKGEKKWKLTHSFFSQALSNHFQTHLIVGLDDEDDLGMYNAAFHFQPSQKPNRYEKQILVPISEYLPLAEIDLLSAFYAKEYNIFYSCTAGSQAKIFSASVPIGPSICYEETYGHLIRKFRQNGAELFVNLTNDAWYPNSFLPKQHFHHGRLRAVENGVFLFRSCNTGVTAVVDAFGQILFSLPVSQNQPGILDLKIPIWSYQTLYTIWGDWAVVLLSAFFALFGVRKKLLL